MLEARCISRLIVAVSVAGLIVGCASEPTPVVTSEATPGDSAQVNVQRGHQFVPVYQFVQDGHQYAFAHAYADGKGPDLLFIDGQLACSSQTPIDELTNWQWVGEPDGLAYLASRLRQACELEPGKAPRTLPFTSDPDQSPKIAGQHWLGYPGDPTDAVLRAGTNFIAVAAFVLAWPVMVPAAFIYSASDGIPKSNADASKRDVSRRMQAITLPIVDTAIAQQLGTPSVQFALPNARTTVLGYAVESGRTMYFGIVDGQAIWIHDPDPWLDKLARRAIKDQKKQR